jgi:antitoxin (DNA-binding transcriptional repressor) of toxin-antitoxin stability system
MPTVMRHEAQSRLLDLIHGLTAEDEVVITENGEPVAKLARAEPTVSWPCKAGSAKESAHWMAPDFDEPLEDFEEYMASPCSWTPIRSFGSSGTTRV